MPLDPEDQLAKERELERLLEAEREASRLAAALAEVDVLVHGSLDSDEVADRALAAGARAMGAETGAIIGVDGDGWLTWQSYNFTPSVIGVRLTDAENPHGVLAVTTLKTVVVEDAYNDSRVDTAFMRAYGLRSVIVAPLIVRGEAVAGLYYNYTSAIHRFTHAEIDFVERLASSLSLALENARLFELEKTKRERLSALHELTELAIACLDSHEVASTARHYLIDRVGVDAVTFWTTDDSRLLLHFGEGLTPGLRDRFPEGVPLGDVSSDGADVVGPVTAALEQHDPNAGALLVLPLKGPGIDMGAVGLAWAEPISLTAEDVAFYSLIANALSVAMDNARLFEQKTAAQGEAQRALATANLLLQTANGLAEWTDLESALTRLADIILAASEHTRVTVDLWDEVRQELTVAVSRGESPIAPGSHPWAVLSDAAHEAITAKVTQFSDYEATKGHSRRTAAQYEARLGLIVPIVHAGETLGLILVDSTGQRREFAPGEVTMIEAVASQAATAIENGLLHDAVRQSREHVTAILNSIGDAFYALDSEWRFTFVNPQAERLLQHSAEELLGHGLWDLFPDLVGSELDTEYRRVVQTHTQASFELYYEPFDLWSDVRVYPAPDGLSVYFRDISKRKVAEAELALSRQRADMLAMLLDDASQPFMVGAPDGRFLLFNSAFEQLTGYSAEQLAVMTWPDDVTSPETLIAEKRAIAEIARTGAPQRFEKEFLRPDGTRVPAEVLRQGHRGEDGQIEYFYAFLTDISERKKAQEAIEAERRQLRDVIEGVPIGITLFGADGAILESNEANRVIWRGEMSEATTAREYGEGRLRRLDDGVPVPAEEAPASRALETGSASAAVVEIERFDGERGKVSFWATPIMDGDGAVSRVVLITQDVGEELEARRLGEALREISTAVTTTLDSGEILTLLVQLAAEAIGAETAGLALERDGEWVVEAAYRLPETARSAMTDSTLAAVVIQATTHEPIVIDDTSSDSRVDQSVMKDLQIKSLMAVPIILQKVVVGALIFHHRTEKAAFSRAETEFATRLMDVATLALENARLYEREHRIADTLQAVVLTPPEQVPHVESAYVYQPASNVANIGGDFYDVFAIDDDHLGIVVGDVSGKGLDAARFTSLMHDGMRAYAYEDWAPCTVLQRMNRLVYRMSPVETFATMFFGVLETTTGLMHYCTAGHPHPIVLGAQPARYLEGGLSTLLGAFEDPEFVQAVEPLTAGDMIVLYTDGITEARADGELLGEERLLSAVRTMEGTATDMMPERVLSAAVTFAGGHLQDDAVVLSVKWLG